MRIKNRDTNLVLCTNCNFWLYNHDNRQRNDEKKRKRRNYMNGLECYACGGKYILPNGRPQWRFNRGTPYVLCPACFNWIEQMDSKYYNREKRQLEQVIRQCYCCGKVGIEATRCYFNYPTNLVLCNNCYAKLFLREKQNQNRIKNQTNQRRISIGGNQKILKSIPRIGVCNWCRRVKGIDCKRTSRHHDENQYDLKNPLRFTIEICNICHGVETRRLEKLGIKTKIYV